MYACDGSLLSITRTNLGLLNVLESFRYLRGLYHEKLRLRFVFDDYNYRT